jgi:uncharacterized protein (DUF2141 family)
MTLLRFFIISILFIAGLSSFTLIPPNTEYSTVQVKITDIRNKTGNFVLGFYKDSESFSKREPFMRKEVAKSNYKDGVVFFELSLPTGNYGIALLDDENKNGKIDYGFLLPIEGFGFSEYYHRGLSSPKYDNFDFNVTSSNKTVVIKMKYM